MQNKIRVKVDDFKGKCESHQSHQEAEGSSRATWFRRKAVKQSS